MRDTRRNFIYGAAAGLSAVPARAEKRPLEPWTPGIKITLQLSQNLSDEDLKFARQLGVGYVTAGTAGGTYETFAKLKQRIEGAGLKVSNIGNTNVHNMPEVTLNLPGRDRKIEEYKQYLRNLGKAGIYYTTYAHMGNGIWNSGKAVIRGAEAREFDMARPNKQGIWAGAVFKEPLSHGREFSKEEIWANYTYFIGQVAPVAEEAGVRI